MSRETNELEPIYLQVRAEVRYWEDATVNGVEDDDGSRIPHRVGDQWCPLIRLCDGKVIDWPDGTTAQVHYKVCDGGTYHLLDAYGREVARWRGDYVPDAWLAIDDRGYGDYLILTIQADGFVRGWQARPLNDDWAPTPKEG